jgi:hypothetical protein
MADVYVAKSKEEGWKVWHAESNSWQRATLQDLLDANMCLNESTGAYIPVDFKKAYHNGDRSVPIQWNALQNKWEMRHGETQLDAKFGKTVTELRVLDEDAVDQLLKKIEKIVDGANRDKKTNLSIINADAVEELLQAIKNIVNEVPDQKIEISNFISDLRKKTFRDIQDEAQTVASELAQSLQDTYQKLDDGVEELLERISEAETPSLDYKKELRIFRESLEETVKKALREELREKLTKELQKNSQESTLSKNPAGILIENNNIPNQFENFKKEILEDFKKTVKELGISAAEKLEIREKFLIDFEKNIKPKMLVDLEDQVRRQISDRIEEKLRRSIRDDLYEKITIEEGPKIREQIINDAKYELLLGITYEQALNRDGSLAKSIFSIFKTKALEFQHLIWKQSVDFAFKEMEKSLLNGAEINENLREELISKIKNTQEVGFLKILQDSFNAIFWGDAVQYFSKSDYLIRRAKKSSSSNDRLDLSDVNELPSDEDEESDFEDDDSDDEEFEQI